MSNEHIPDLTIRKLWPHETDRLRDHLLRLDKASRQQRFAHAVADSYIEGYAQRMNDMGGIAIGAFVGGEVRAVAELRKLGDTWGREAEAAFSVERQYQDKGLGSELMGRIIRAARNRGVNLLYLSCLAENARMRTIARKHDADLRFEYGEVIGEIIPETADYFSLVAEAVEDRVGYMMTVLDLSARLVKAA
ncbi:MAG: GNAT family N-acetyltransferase [Hyphomicrobiaceae bacterium]